MSDVQRLPRNFVFDALKSVHFGPSETEIQTPRSRLGKGYELTLLGRRSSVSEYFSELLSAWLRLG